VYIVLLFHSYPVFYKSPHLSEEHRNFPLLNLFFVVAES